jgi:hypothetical protein
MPLETTNKKKRFSWMSSLLVISFFATAVTIGLLISTTQKPTELSFGAVLAGSVTGFFGAWLLYFSITQFYLRLIRGYPFNVGDRVEVTNGPHKGKTGTILMADKQQGFFKIDIGVQSDQSGENYFDEFEIRRLRK